MLNNLSRIFIINTFNYKRLKYLGISVITANANYGNNFTIKF